MSAEKVALIILDGWGIGNGDQSDAIQQANTPFFDDLINTYPHAELLTYGEHVGLPDGQMGNSEVGHLNIGAGRIVYQDYAKINKAIADDELSKNKTLIEAFEQVKQNNAKLHFIGLLSDGGVHSHQHHFTALCNLADKNGVEQSFVHAFTDGRDTDPRSGLHCVKQFEERIRHTPTKIASVVGRYFAMDRDQRWERIKLAYDLLVFGKGKKHASASEAIEASYQNEVTDEFIKPAVITDNQNLPLATIAPNDVVICVNFRTDRCREITQVLTQKSFPDFEMKPMDLHYYTMTNYDKTFKGINVLFDKENLIMTLGEVLAQSGKTQTRIAETEKYPHVTFFFSGGREEVFPNEERILIQSPKVATYDLQPEMSAPEVSNAICKNINEKTPDFICLNFANPDMVGHTGVFNAIIKAVETTDYCTRQVVEAGLKKNYQFVIIADHGNADMAVNPDGSPNTAHSTNPVPIIVISPKARQVKDGILADVAPTILSMMGINQAKEMTGNSLID